MEPPEQRTTFQHYEVERREDGSLYELGRGAMGVTYKALDSNLHVSVALKVITGILLPDARARTRFLREARAAAQLRHSNVATVYHLGQEADFCFYTMEFVDGETLEARVRREGPMDPRTALTVCQQTARALQAAHSRGLLHRDLKPSNLMLTAEGEEMLVKVIDFGLVKPLQQDSADSSASLSGGLFLGTPLYASPEQCASEDGIDGRADLYSLGATLWFMLTGGPPFKGSMRTVITQHMTKSPAFEALVGQPLPIVTLLRDLLAKEATDRPADAGVLRSRLTEILATLESNVGPRVGNIAVPPAPISVPTLDDILRKRGSLPPDEVAFLLPRLTSLLDGVSASQTALPDLSTRNVRLRLDTKDRPAATEALLALPLRQWPPFTVETFAPPPSAATASPDATLLDAPANAPAMPVESLALLVYELLEGTPLPISRVYRPLSGLSETGNAVMRDALPLGEKAAYAKVAEFTAALIRAIEEGSTFSGVIPPSVAATRQAGQKTAPPVPIAIPAASLPTPPPPPTPPLPAAVPFRSGHPIPRMIRRVRQWRTDSKARYRDFKAKLSPMQLLLFRVAVIILVIKLVSGMFSSHQPERTSKRKRVVTIIHSSPAPGESPSESDEDDDDSPAKSAASASASPSPSPTAAAGDHPWKRFFTENPAGREIATASKKALAEQISKMKKELDREDIPPEARKAIEEQIKKLDLPPVVPATPPTATPDDSSLVTPPAIPVPPATPSPQAVETPQASRRR